MEHDDDAGKRTRIEAGARAKGRNGIVVILSENTYKGRPRHEYTFYLREYQSRTMT